MQSGDDLQVFVHPAVEFMLLRLDVRFGGPQAGQKVF
jgi:hypothetical protein